MYIELHILQNFAPNCLNRDDTNSPKDCVFGGYRRARISSQCCKRAVRTSFRDDGLLPPEDLATRTKRLVTKTAKVLSSDHGRDEGESIAKATAALGSQSLKADDKHETQYLLFVGQREIENLARVVDDHWDDIAVETTPDDDGKAKKKKMSKKTKVPKEVESAVATVLDGGKAADLALFGRMLADLPQKNVDAASQVAHAISTNAVALEMDFYTAVDDLKARSEEAEDAGAGMLGTIEFNSACYYRYSNVHVPQLVDNLQGDTDLAKRTVEAFLQASVRAIPTGKQNSFAAHNPPSVVLAVVRTDAPVSLANAFADPIDARRDDDLVTKSASELVAYWGKMNRVYGSDGVIASSVLVVDDVELASLTDARVETLDDLISKTASAVDFDAAAKQVAS